MILCLLFGRHKWMPRFLSGTGEWMRGCVRCPEIEWRLSRESDR
jgi:hypothetical protein